MICGAEELIAVCKELIAPKPHQLSADGKFSWEEVECMGACTNAPMAQIGKDYYEDLTAEKLRELIDRFSNGEVPVPGPQNGRYASEPLGGADQPEGIRQRPDAIQRLGASGGGPAAIRSSGSTAPKCRCLTPWRGKAAKATPARGAAKEPKPGKGSVADETGVTVQEAPATVDRARRAPRVAQRRQGRR